jgi:hypothetical protein
VWLAFGAVLVPPRAPGTATLQDHEVRLPYYAAPYSSLIGVTRRAPPPRDEKVTG